MSGINYLKKFDKSQLWRFFIDGRFQKRYNGWVGYEAGERGSIQALLNGFTFMLENFDISSGLRATYLRELHKICMLSVKTANLKSSPGDIRYLNGGIPFFAKSTTKEHLIEVFDMRRDDGTIIFNSKKWGKTANELNVDEVYKFLLEEGNINYRNWYPNLDKRQEDAILGKRTLHEFYEAKHSVQMMMVSKMENIIDRYNTNIKKATTDEERLKVISLVPRELELLHPFPDGNSRTFSCVTLTHLLMFNGFAPALLENPNLDNEVSHAQWIEEIKKGMQRTKELIANPTMKLFDYSILDMQKKDIAEFLNMATELTKKIDNFSELFLTPARVAKYTNGTWLGEINENMRFSGVGTYATVSEGNIYFFIALDDWKKEKKNIEHEIKTVLKKGVSAVVLDDLQYAYLIDVPILHVKDCFLAFKQSAIEVRQEHNPYTVLLTGTEGKTGAKVQLHHILNKQVRAHAVLNSANIEIPVLRSLINLDSEDKVEINEVSVGADEPYRVERTKMVNPDLCFFTNIGPNHMDLHGSLDNIFIAKSSVVEGLREGGVCIVNSEIEYLQKLLDAIEARRPNTPILTYGRKKSDNARLISQTFDTKRFGWHVKANIEGEKVSYYLPMVQEHTPLASVGVLYLVKYMGYDVKKAANDYDGIKPYESMGQMLSIRKKSGTIDFYDQSRRGAIHGMRSAFIDLKNFKPNGKIVALIGGISTKKDSAWTKESHLELAKMINSSNIDRLYTTGNFMNYVHENLKKPEILIKHSEDLDELAQLLFADIEGGDLLFIIGNAYLYLGRVSEKIMKLKDNSKYDYNIENYPLSKKNLNMYKYMITCDEVEHKKPLELSLINNHLNIKEYDSLNKKYKTFTELRTQMLLDFFKSVDKLVLSHENIKLVNSDIIATGNESYVNNEEFAKAWFNNIDKIDKLPKKQLFGSFYNFGDKKYLLHVEVATINLHIGFVKYEIENGIIKALKMNNDDIKDVDAKFGDRFGEEMALKERKWGLRWFTYDCGSFIDFTRANIFATVVDVKHSKFYKELSHIISKLDNE